MGGRLLSSLSGSGVERARRARTGGLGVLSLACRERARSPLMERDRALFKDSVGRDWRYGGMGR